MNASLRAGGILGLLVSFPVGARACTVCMGGNGTLGEAANGAIFVMLGVLVLVLGLISLVGYSLVRRGKAPLPAHAEFLRAVSNPNLN